jgi:hypothetical protein
MLNTSYVSLFTLDEFKKYATYTLPYVSELSGDTNEFTYDSSIYTCRVNKTNTTDAVGFRIPIIGLINYDMIEIECEYRLISGENPWLLVQSNGGIGDARRYQFNNTGEWEKVKTTFMIGNTPTSNETSYIEIGGYATSQIGTYEIRNVMIKVSSQSNNFFENSINNILANCRRLVFNETIEYSKGIWNTIRYEDGYQETCGVIKFENVPCEKAAGSAYYASGDLIRLGQMPRYFASYNYFSVTPVCDSDYVLLSIIGSPEKNKLTLPNINLFRFTPGTISKIELHVHIKGTWK